MTHEQFTKAKEIDKQMVDLRALGAKASELYQGGKPIVLSVQEADWLFHLAEKSLKDQLLAL